MNTVRKHPLHGPPSSDMHAAGCASPSDPEFRVAERSARTSIVHVVAPAPYGGLESVVQALASAQHASGHRVRVAAVTSGAAATHPFVERLRTGGVPVVVVDVPNRSYRAERRTIRRICREAGAEILHTHGYRPDVVDGGVAHSVGARSVTTVHGFTGGGWKNRSYEWMQRRAYRRFDAVVAVSAHLGRQLDARGVSASRTYVIPNAWSASGPTLSRDSARRELGIPPREFAIGWVGRVSHEKGLDVLIDALSGVADLPVSLSVVGDGPERARLVLRTADLGLSARVRWHGSVREASRLYQAFDAFVLSSRTEGTPIALFEAMAGGVPVIATAVGGVPDVLVSGTGLLVPGENPAALEDAIRQIFVNPVGARTRAAAARARIDSAYGVSPWLERYDQVYDRVRARKVS